MSQNVNGNKMSGNDLQLELLANIHELTIRIRWNNNSKDSKDKDLIINDLNNILYEYYGILSDPNFIEDYEYLNDRKRRDLITSNNYTFETSNIDYKKSYTGKDNHDDDNFAEWKYDTVIKCQFKKKSLLDSTLFKIEQILNDSFSAKDRTSGNQLVDRWSISINNHALKNPNNIFIGNIDPDVTLEELNHICEDFGPILSIKLIDNKQNKDKPRNDSNSSSSDSGKMLKNYGFVSFQLGSQASNCINHLNGKVINGSPLLVNYHVERKERERLFWNQFKANDGIYNFNNIMNMNHQNKGNKNDKKNRNITANESYELDYEKDDYNEVEGENNFRCVFIGNVPKYIQKMNEDVDNNEDGNHYIIVTEGDVIDMVNKNLKKECPDFEILSYYFPLENNVDQSSGNDQSLLKGYGFIKVKTHSLALKCIEILNLYEWHGHKLNVNRAIQNRVNHIKQSRNRNNIGNGDNFRNYYNNTNKPNYMENSFSHSTSFLDFMPHQYMNVPPYGQNMAVPNSTSSLSSLSSIQPMAISEGEYNIKKNTNDIENTVHSPTIMTPMLQYPSYPSQPVPVPNFYPSPVAVTPLSIPMNSPYPPNIPGHLPIPLDTQQESNLYVKHLPLTWTDDDLHGYYEKFGKIISAKIITVGGSTKKNISDAESGELGTSKGYGFVCFENPVDASRAILATNGVCVDKDQILEVSFANKKNTDLHRNNIENTHNDNNNNNNNGFSSNKNLRYNRKFLNALMEEQNAKFIYNPQIQRYSPIGTGPMPGMVIPPQQGIFPPMSYNYPAGISTPLSTFVPLSPYGPIDVPFPKQSQC